MKRCISSILAVLFLFLSGCGAPTVGDTGAVRQFFAMDTFMSITVHGAEEEEAATAARAEVDRLERLLSRTRPESQISALNTHAGDHVPILLEGEVFDLLNFCQSWEETVKGAFNPTLAPVMDLWGFTGETYRVPSQGELSTALTRTEGGLVLDEANGSARLTQKGMAVDLGGAAKGYAGSQVAEILRTYEVDSALVALGGGITALGVRPDGAPWSIAVRDPKHEEDYLCVLPLTDKTMSTSGGYERYFEQDGTTYHHIIDPHTGYPAESGLLSVTVVSENATLTDVLSTALFVLGPQEAISLWRNRDDFELILAKTDGTVLVTEGLKEGLDFRGETNGYSCEIVRR